MTLQFELLVESLSTLVLFQKNLIEALQTHTELDGTNSASESLSKTGMMVQLRLLVESQSTLSLPEEESQFEARSLLYDLQSKPRS